MGMLKTSARTALRDKTIDGDGPATLSLLMERLNVVLPEVKEAHMYATFTALRLNADGRVFYGMAASPPILHWSAAAQRVDCIEEAQFPLALLPVDTFGACELVVERGDLLLIATDGIIEVRSKKGPKPEVEFGVGSLQSLMRAHAELPLPELAGTILKTVQDFGKQLDDQTLLLVRRTA
jgi:sigma-B regulation protein RsbU (phosphoserine phosphatase)